MSYISRLLRSASAIRWAPFVRNLFISVKETPNPDVQKFLPTPPITVLPAEFGHTMVRNSSWM